MANSLLDFVMALVRDPEAAARYAADPAGALADAQLTGVTIADVANLIPVVTDSLAASTPGFGPSVNADAGAGNVWTTGAAAAAFDAFNIELPARLPAAEQAVAPPASIPPAALPEELSSAPFPEPPVAATDSAETPEPFDVDWAAGAEWPQHTRLDTDVDQQSGTGDLPGF